MKKAIVFILFTMGLLSAKWFQVRVPLNQGITVHELAGFDIVELKPGYAAEIVVNQSELDVLAERGITYVVVIDDLEVYYSSRMSGSGPFGNYYTLAEAYSILDSLHEQYPDLITERMVLPNDDYDGLTIQGNYVYAVKISDNVESDEDEPEVLFTGLHHAREPICVNICVEGARMFCQEYGTDPLITHLVDNREIWIIPILNPDGYLINEAAFPAGGGMHRKNGNPAGQPNPGVDLNRNYPYKWGLDDQGSSPIPQMDNYRGTAPGSEPETQSIMNLCKEHDFVTAVNYHSHANYFMYPWGYTSAPCEDIEVFRDWGEAATRGNFYAVMAGVELYPTNGGSDDWMYGERTEKGKIYAVTIEVGDEFWEDASVPRHLEENLPLLVESAKAAGVYAEIRRLWWSDENEDGNISPGEKVNLVLDIKNTSVRDATGEVEVKLEGSDSRIDILTPSASIPSIGPRQMWKGETGVEVLVSPSALPDSAVELTMTINSAGFSFVHQVILPVGDENATEDLNFDSQTAPGWQTDGWNFTTEQSHSGKYSMTDSPYGPYPASSDATLTSPKIDLGDALIAELSFWHRFSTEETWDWAALQIKTKAYEDWNTIKHWCGSQDEWTEETFNLNSYCGSESLQIRFLLESNGENQFDGWYVDDIRLVTFDGKVTSGAIAELTDVRKHPVPVSRFSDGKLHFSGPHNSQLEVSIIDITGRQVATTSGNIPFCWDVKSDARLVPGVYFVKTSSLNFEHIQKVVLTR
ncbi:hypothetical protein GF359_02855 [candidate division WOR-3 bacterium]|uniref:Peptidase M14 domain-containing protein n=1 Tax=candidate division WOR-3 bacterium TaxID=2052148 RepID=A0A9D5K8A5_UNCW3|nr:hypothetical protein [candidate division WOR-3 bacterium]MBD3364133.1 hypothetical protein [candidate division WOR-3 bacterium]